MNPDLDRDRMTDPNGQHVPQPDLSTGNSSARRDARVDPGIERDWNQTSRDWGQRAERTFARTGDSEFMGSVRRFIRERPVVAAAAGLAAAFLIGRRRR